MERIEIRVKANSPLSLGTIKAYGGTLIESGNYVKGAHLRGALGSVKPHLSDDQKADIDHILGPDGRGISMPNCYPAFERVSFPLPLTAYSCKREPGFKTDREARSNSVIEPHGVVDTLFVRLAYDRLADFWNSRSIPIPFKHSCRVCGNKTEHLEAFAEPNKGAGYSRGAVFRHRQTRVAINRSTLTHQESQLYSVSAVEPGTSFIGSTIIDSDQLERLTACLGLVERLGGRTSRGFGKVEVSARKLPSAMSVRERIENFNEKYFGVLSDLESVAQNANGAGEYSLLFTINLRSDALLRTMEGVPSLDISQDVLRDKLRRFIHSESQLERFDKIPLRKIAQHTRPIILSGWNTAWQLPKETFLASRMGGVYAFEAQVKDTADRELLIETLSNLEQCGIGEFQSDGYGQIAICDEFHLEVEPA